MKKFIVSLFSGWRISLYYCLIALLSLCNISCGGDDTGEDSNSNDGNDFYGGEYKLVDGVNVVNGKRIAELRVLDEDDPYHSSNFDNSYYYLTDKVYRLEYDTKGRLFKIICGLVVVAQFDYDLKTIN